MSTERNDGGPAFPRPLSKLSPEEFSVEQDGMSLRDWFAGMALQGLLAATEPDDYGKSSIDDGVRACLVRESFRAADAMLEARKQ